MTIAPVGSCLGVACYGVNGHQIHGHAVLGDGSRLVGTAGFPDSASIAGRRYSDLDALLGDPEVDLVSLCSPRRADQAADAIRCLRAGKHVYAEKPCALEESALDAILAAAQQSGRSFREMAGSQYEPHYQALLEQVRGGRIGRPFQVLIQKSYPWHAERPQDEAVDGGLFLQVGVHAARIAEALADSPIESAVAEETSFGNPGIGSLRMAAACILRHASGCVSVAAINYGNTATAGVWGNDTARVFGPRGFVTSERGGAHLELTLVDQPPAALPAVSAPPGHLARFVRELRGLDTDLPSPMDELRPLRQLLRARSALRAASRPISHPRESG